MQGAVEDEDRSKTETAQHVTGSLANLFLSPSLCWNAEVRVLGCSLLSCTVCLTLLQLHYPLIKPAFYAVQSIKHTVFKGNDEKIIRGNFSPTPKNISVWGRKIYRTTKTTMARRFPDMNEFWLGQTTVPSALWPLYIQLYKPKSLLTVWWFPTPFTPAEHNGILNNLHYPPPFPIHSLCSVYLHSWCNGLLYTSGRLEENHSPTSVGTRQHKNGKNCFPTFLRHDRDHIGNGTTDETDEEYLFIWFIQLKIDRRTTKRRRKQCDLINLLFSFKLIKKANKIYI
jgi:hypothetical protein